VQESLPTRGRGYRVRLREPRILGVALSAIELAGQYHVSLPQKTASAIIEQR